MSYCNSMASTVVSTANCSINPGGVVTQTILFVVALGLIAFWWRKSAKKCRAAYIDDYQFHPGVINKFREVRPGLRLEQEELVFAALRDYFHLCNSAGRRMVAMPSQVVDDAWHAFILFTRAYQQFSRLAFGRFLHHTPAEAMTTPTQAGEGIKRAWRLACARDGVNPKHPVSLPLLFVIDADLNITNGFYYTPNCQANPRRSDGNGNYCGSHVGCSSGCGGDSGGSSNADGGGGFFDGWGDGGDGGGDGGGCGGD
jgi:hypothetical protein